MDKIIRICALSEGVASNRIRLLYKARRLIPGNKLTDYGVKHDDTILMVDMGNRIHSAAVSIS